MIRVSDAVAPDHPALAGHFPGNPIVPGVLLLSRVFEAVARSYGAAIVGMPGVKFLAPLAPGQRFDIELDQPPAGGAVKFSVTSGTLRIASGTLHLKVGVG